MKTPKFTTVEKIPQWAVCYLVNADDSALETWDRALVDSYVARLERKGLRLVCPVDGTESEFELHPAFGQACGTVDFTAEVLPPDRIVFRKYWNDYDNRWTPRAFLLDVEARPGWIMSYEHRGQHCEASMNYYWDTKPCEPELYAPLLKELESIGYRPRVMKRIMRTNSSS